MLDVSLTLQGAGGVGGLLREGGFYPLYDANGNITQKLDGSGATAMSVAYDPFGNIIGGSLVGEYGFSTKPLDAQTGFYYYGYRWYDPVDGRWISRDPIEEDGGVNLYMFAQNDGVNGWDYLGMTTGDAAMRDALGGMFSGTTTANRHFDSSHSWTYEMSNHPHMASVRSRIEGQITSYCRNKSSVSIGKPERVPFDLNALGLVKNARVYLRDYFAALGAASAAYSMGSFRLRYVINSIDCSKCSANVSFYASDALRFGSLTRVPKTDKSIFQFIALMGLGSTNPNMPVTMDQFAVYDKVLSMKSTDFDEPFGPNAPFNTINLSWSWSEIIQKSKK